MGRYVRIVALRAFGRLASSFPAYFSSALFLVFSAGAFAYGVFRAEGTADFIPGVWALATLPVVPVLASLLTAGLWSEDLASGYVDALLVTHVPERDFVLGRFLASFAFGALVLALHLFSSVLLLAHHVRTPFAAQLTLWSFLPAYVGTLFPLAFTLAVGAFAGLCTKRGSIAALTTVFITLVLPAAVLVGAQAVLPGYRVSSEGSPFAVFALAAADGTVSFSGTAFYFAFTFAALFAASKRLASVRFSGNGAGALRWSTRFAVCAGLLFAVLAAAAAYRYDFRFDIPLVGRAAALRGDVRFSARTRQILAETRGGVTVTCFMAKSSPAFRPAARLLRGLSDEARRRAGTRIRTVFVDPRWDLSKAARFVKQGIPEGSVIFECGHRSTVLPAVEADEATCAAAILRLMRPGRETVCWITGHGETAFDDYDGYFGMSDAVRVLMRNGYSPVKFDLSQTRPVPDDCAFAVVVGARTPFSSAERKRLDAYLRKGGRLMVLAGLEPKDAGAAALLAEWGISFAPAPAGTGATVTGSDRVVRDFADHAVTRPIRGASLVFGSEAAALAPVPVNGDAGADRVVFTPLASADGVVYAAAVERGGSFAADIALRPVRIVAVGDAAFALNGSLTRRANANADFLVNAAAWLAGLDASMAVSRIADTVDTGMDRSRYLKFAARTCSIAPLGVLAFGLVMLFRRRRRL